MKIVAYGYIYFRDEKLKQSQKVISSKRYDCGPHTPRNLDYSILCEAKFSNNHATILEILEGPVGIPCISIPHEMQVQLCQYEVFSCHTPPCLLHRKLCHWPLVNNTVHLHLIVTLLNIMIKNNSLLTFYMLATLRMIPRCSIIKECSLWWLKN